MNAETNYAVDARPRRKHPLALWGAFLALLGIVLTVTLASIGNTSFIDTNGQTRSSGITGFAPVSQGHVAACVNIAPNLTIDCQPIAFVGTPYSCRVNASDPQQTTLIYDVQRLLGPISGDGLFAMSGPWMNFTAVLSQNGSYTLLFTVNDDQGCENSVTSALFNLTINISANNPFLAAPLPDQSFPAGTIIIPFDLDDYFIDPNNDPLAYSVSGNNNLGVSIANGVVTITPAANWCGEETLTFTATDPDNNTAVSNPVVITAICPPQPPQTPSSSSSGGGGGGGGGAQPQNACVNSYFCYDWSECQFTRYVTLVDGEPTSIRIDSVRGSEIYTISPEGPYDPDSYYEGFQYRRCIDTNRCTTDVDVYVRSCNYQPNCFDGIKNQDETAVDCGGVCGPCSACSDGIQNGLEEGVDCGGPFCEACNTCTNGVMDGDEDGVDCGGPDCPNCGTCFDGVQNGLEEGVDCGGPFCRSCAEEQFPLAGMPWLSLVLAILVGLALLFLVAITLKRQLANMLMKLLLRHKRKNRRIIITSDLKAEIIRRLAELESKIGKQPMLRSQEQLAGIIRDYFRGALGIPFEFTNEELGDALVNAKLNPLLESVLRRFFERINVLEFSGLTVTPLVLAALVQETREIVYQTAVLTVDDLRERERDLAVRDIPAAAPSLDKGYLLLSEVQQAIRFGKLELADALYTVLDQWYARTDLKEQRAVYEDLMRVYDELRLAHGATSATPMPASESVDHAERLAKARAEAAARGDEAET